MKIQLVSDVHLELRSKPEAKQAVIDQLVSNAQDADLLVVAGDVSPNPNTRKLFLEALASSPCWPLGIVLVLGNHDYWSSWNTANETDAAFSQGKWGPGSIADEAVPSDRVHILQRRSLILSNGVRILGCTLWSDAQPGLGELMNDFVKIPGTRKMKLTLQGFRDLHLRDKAWLEAELNKPFGEGKTLVVTHHAPSFRVLEAFNSKTGAGSPYASGYASHLDGLVEKADLWCFGHTHRFFDAKFGNKGRLVSNPLGYPGEPGVGHRADFVMDL